MWRWSDLWPPESRRSAVDWRANSAGCSSIPTRWSFASTARSAAIFERESETAFRRYEHAAIRSALDRSQAHVIALGGGALTLPENRDLLQRASHSVFIKISAEQAFERARRGRGIRPMLGPSPTLERIGALYASRMDDYAAADLIVDATQCGDAEIIDTIVAWLDERSTH